MTGASSNNHQNNECASWLELESDPGLFTLLVDDFGVKGVQVEEIYDLSKPLDSSIFGFIFLFKWIERRSRRSKAAALELNSNFVTDANIVNKMFFAHQIIPNSCATHALLSILLNCKHKKYFDLGDLLGKFQKLCDGLSPEIKGLAIGNQPKLAEAHNSYAKPENLNRISSTSNSSKYSNKNSNINNSTIETNASTSYIASSSSSYSTGASSNTNHNNNNNSSYLPSFNSSTSSSTYGSNNGLSTTSTASSISQSLSNTISNASSPEIFHFICFVPIDGRLYELDGLKPFPVDHGPINLNNLKNINNNFTQNINNFSNVNEQSLFNNIDSNQALLTSLVAASGLLNSISNNLNSNTNWTHKFKQIIRQRINSFNNGPQNHEIRFNLMAVVPDKMLIIREKIDLMNNNVKKIVHTINQCEFYLKSAEEEQRSKFFMKQESSNLNENTFSSSSPSSTSSSDSISSLVTESNKNPIDSLESNVRQLRSKSSFNNQLNLTEISKSPVTTSLQKQQKLFENIQIIFNLNSNELINELVKNFNNISNNLINLKPSQNDVNTNNLNNLKFRNELSNILKKLDIVDLKKLFRIECIKFLKQKKIKIETNKDDDNYKMNQNNNLDDEDNYDDENGENEFYFDENNLNIVDDNLNYFKRVTSLEELKIIEVKLKNEIDSDESKYNEEIEKKNKYKIDAQRRKHIYDEFIVTYLKILAENGKLSEIVKNGLSSVDSSINGNSTSGKSCTSSLKNFGSIFLQKPFAKKQRKK